MSNPITQYLETFPSCACRFFQEKKDLIFFLAAVALLVYGFELFNFNLTIDEEVHAFGMAPSVWIEQGRWGMYLLNRFLLPYTIVPVVPLFIALISQILAALFLVEGWRITSKTDQMLLGAVFLAYPGIAYMYTFSTINYGIGVGLFCVGLALLSFEQLPGWGRLAALIPAAFAVAIYQGFIVALTAVFLVSYVIHLLNAKRRAFQDLLVSAGIVLGGTLIYYLIHKVLVTFFVPESSYVGEYFDFASLQTNLTQVLASIATVIIGVYSGGKEIYGIRAWALLALISAVIAGFGYSLVRSKLSLLQKMLAAALLIFLFLLPFLTGLLMGGYIAMRFLVALPVVLSGLVALGATFRNTIFRSVLVILTALCVLQFAVSTNHLFAASHIALQEDRLIAANLIKSIEQAKYQAGTEEVRYVEMVGYLRQPANALNPKIETFGASYFQWDQGNVDRMLFFLRTLGYEGLSALPGEKRGDYIDRANEMPNWPREGSVTVVEDTVLIKFAPYSNAQKNVICAYSRTSQTRKNEQFCE